MRRNLPAYSSELAGTAIMPFIGVSAVALRWSFGSPVPVVPNAARAPRAGRLGGGMAVLLDAPRSATVTAATDAPRRRVKAVTMRVAGRV